MNFFKDFSSFFCELFFLFKYEMKAPHTVYGEFGSFKNIISGLCVAKFQKLFRYMENRGTFGLVWFSNKIIFDMKYGP